MKKFMPVTLFVAFIAGAAYLTIGLPKGEVKGRASETTISVSELSSHSSPSNCWTAVDGQVYDITKFIPLHPGGESILLGCGKDATGMFTTFKDGGRPHSQKARQILLSLVHVGVLTN